MTVANDDQQLEEIKLEQGSAVEEVPPIADEDKKIPWYRFGNYDVARAYNTVGMGRGALVMSNIFLSTSFIYLAQKQAGCLDQDLEVIENCVGKAYGFKPASIVSNIAVIAGVTSALFMPFIGAMVDYTPHRKNVGIFTAVAMILIQTVQIGTVSKTWLYMAFLQAFAAFLYQAQILAVYAYLPDMSYFIGEEIMTKYTADFVMTQFGNQTLFLLVIIVISLSLGLDDVVAAQVSQSVNVVWSGTLFYLGWKLFPAAPAKQSLAEGRGLITAGFNQVLSTAKLINAKYKKGARWFFLSLIFAEAAANAFTTVSVIFLDEQLGLSGTGVAIFFLVVLVFSLPGAWLAPKITNRLDPKRSWQLCMVVIFVWSAGGAMLLDVVPTFVAFIWGSGIGVLLGWFYSTENLFFSLCLPKGQEAELSGFYVYCTQILGWLPPLIFSLMVETDINQTYGLLAVVTFFLIAVLLLGCAAPWEEILIDSGRQVLDENVDSIEQGETEEKASPEGTGI